MTDMEWGMDEELWNEQEFQPAGTAGAPRNRLNGFRIGSPAGKLVITVVLYALWFGILTLMSAVHNDIFTGVMAFIIVIAGWKGITSIQPRMFLFMPIVGWILYFGVKLVASVFAGIFLAPWYLAKWIFLRV